MLKFKLVDIVLLVIIVLILDKLYLLPLYIPLNTTPDSRRSATYLAKTIAKEAKCEDIWLLDINYIKGDTMLHFDCIFDTYINFSIHVFLNDKIKDEMINNLDKDNQGSYPGICFKQGSRYMICESGALPNKIGKPIFRGEKYYKQFPGEDLEYRLN